MIPQHQILFSSEKFGTKHSELKKVEVFRRFVNNEKKRGFKVIIILKSRSGVSV